MVFFFATGSTITAENSSFEYNYAPVYGGVAVITSASSATFKNCQLLINTAGNTGGALYVTASSSLTSNGSIFTNNYAAASSDSFAGSIYLESSSGDLSNNIFNHHSGMSYGSVIYSTQHSDIVGYGNTFDDNIADNDGGCLYLANSSYKSEKDTFTNNVADVGGVLTLHDSEASCIDCYFSRNKAWSRGMVFEVDTGILTVDGAIAEYHNSSGHSFINILNEGVVIVNNTLFRNNTVDNAPVFLRARRAASANIRLLNTNISDIYALNIPGTAGGAISMNSQDNIFYAKNCRFENVVNYFQGGVMHIQGKRTAPGRGGSVVEMEDMVFSKNNGDYFAGAIQVKYADFSCTRCHFEANNVSFTDTPFGNSIYAEDANVTLQDCVGKDHEGYCMFIYTFFLFVHCICV